MWIVPKYYSHKAATIHIRICPFWIWKYTSSFELIFFLTGRHITQEYCQIISDFFKMPKYDILVLISRSRLNVRCHTSLPRGDHAWATGAMVRQLLVWSIKLMHGASALPAKVECTSRRLLVAGFWLVSQSVCWVHVASVWSPVQSWKWKGFFVSR